MARRLLQVTANLSLALLPQRALLKFPSAHFSTCPTTLHPFNINMTSTLSPPPPPTWNYTPAEVVSLTQTAIDNIKKLDDQIAAIPVAQATWENTMEPMIEQENEDKLSSKFYLLKETSPDKELREACNAAVKDVQKASIDSSMRHDVYLRVQHVFNNLEKIKQEKKLSPELVRLLEKTEQGYRRSGLALDEETRNKVSELKKRMADLTLAFSKNLADDEAFIPFSEEELEGVPKEVYGEFAKTDDGKFKMSFKYPEMFPVLEYAKSPAVRKQVFVENENRAADLNTPLMEETIAIRSQLAKLLGYRHHSDFVLDIRMAKKFETVRDFLEDLKVKLRVLGEKDYKSLLALKQKECKENGWDFDGKLHIWDVKYYNTMQIKNDLQVDQHKISEFFPLSRILSQAMAFYEKLFSLRFEEVANVEAWHEDVKLYRVYKRDAPTEEFAGYIYLDLHPRPNKYGHAANFGFSPGYYTKEGKRVPPCTALVCNFTKPTATKPSLMKHNEVTTFFHELGHGIHSIVADTQTTRFHGTAVARDFVECPSQILEFWTWEPVQIKEISQHYETGEKLDDALIDSLIRSKHVNDGLFYLRQVHFASFDLAVHSRTEESPELDLQNLWNGMREEISLVGGDNEKMAGYAKFAHIMGGYDSGYYGYLWSEVFAADIYYTRFKADPMNPKAGLEYRQSILDRGGSRDEMDGLREVLGRDPNNDAFLQELGVSDRANL